MINLRRYGDIPYCVAAIHGGPGAGGEMAPVARELASQWGVLEPIQTATSLEGQVEELRSVLEENGDLPVTLIGYSWGAWLSYIVTARHPALAKKLILVSSGPFEDKYVARLTETRLSRLGEGERVEWTSILKALGDPEAEDKDTLLARLGALASKTDTYDPITREYGDAEHVGGEGDIFQNVWRDAAEMRRSGRLLALADQIQCPVVAIHGDYDPHPAKGVREPLSANLARFRFILLERCGHTPWLERQARAEFYNVLKQEPRRRSSVTWSFRCSSMQG
jgi:pimeloyl-ACP methyl ester carboxylesterase